MKALRPREPKPLPLGPCVAPGFFPRSAFHEAGRYLRGAATLRFGTLFIGLCLLTGGAIGAPLNLVLIGSHEALPYKQVAEGFCRKFGPEANIRTYWLDQCAEEGCQVGAYLTPTPDLVVTLGQVATESVARSRAELPMVAGMVLDNVFVQGRGSFTGVSLEHSAEVQMEWLHRLLPEVRTVGLLYEPGADDARLRSYQYQAQRNGFKLSAVPVNSPEDIPPALESLSSRVQVLLTTHNPRLYSPQMARSILLFSFRQRIPVVGLSDAWVKAGAIYAVTWDYRDLGAQLADLASRLLDGEVVAASQPQSPREAHLAVNVKTAEHMHLELPAVWVQSAEQVYP